MKLHIILVSKVHVVSGAFATQVLQPFEDVYKDITSLASLQGTYTLNWKYAHTAVNVVELDEFVDQADIVVATIFPDGSHPLPGVGLLVIVGDDIQPSQLVQAIDMAVIHETIKDVSFIPVEFII